MGDRWQVQYEFWSGFGIPAYEENSVPDQKELEYPYITYEAAGSGFNDPVSITDSIWDRNSSWETADRLADLIEHHIRTENLIKYDKGRCWISIGDTVFAQNMGDPDDNYIKRKILNVTFEFEQEI